ncbi:MAG: hypothetical protein HDT25_05955 [Ruminococcus sp.]|nr:hypothetical protein [Ruminococcus sp.]
MIAIGIILALSAVFIAGLLVFWKKIVEWIKKAANKIKQVLGLEPDGTKTFISKTIEGFKNKSKYYYKNKVTKEWEEVVYTKEVDEEEVPPDILAKVRNKPVGTEISTTEELRLALEV